VLLHCAVPCHASVNITKPASKQQDRTHNTGTKTTKLRHKHAAPLVLLHPGKRNTATGHALTDKASKTETEQPAICHTRLNIHIPSDSQNSIWLTHKTKIRFSWLFMQAWFNHQPMNTQLPWYNLYLFHQLFRVLMTTLKILSFFVFQINHKVVCQINKNPFWCFILLAIP
jgi:hypothetical protein